MAKKNNKRLIWIIAIIAVAAILIYICCNKPQIIGGDKDEHGCLIAAGYSWCDAKQKCLRVWEEECPITENVCTEAGGNWNECSSKCRLDNQGNEGAACTLECQQLCECGGIAGFECPEGYTCKMPAGIADALGYCER